MPRNLKMGFADGPVLDRSGFATGLVVGSRIATAVANGRDEFGEYNEQEYLRFELEMLVPSLKGGEIKQKWYAGATLNPDPRDFVGRGKAQRPVYSKLTGAVLSLGLATIGDLQLRSEEVAERVKAGLENLEGEHLRFKMIKPKGKTFHAIVHTTFEVVPQDVPEAAPKDVPDAAPKDVPEPKKRAPRKTTKPPSE